MSSMMSHRKSGILLHITSLPSPYGIGDLGFGSYRFVDFLKKNNQQFWQILPLNPTNTVLGNSPYSSCSAFAANPLLISPDMLVKDGFLSKTDIEEHPSFSQEKVNFEAVTKYKQEILELAYQKFKGKASMDKSFNKFCAQHADWLDDFSLFIALKNSFNGQIWNQWPKEVRDREKTALNKAKKNLAKDIEKEKFIQYLFFRQWDSLRKYCSSQNIKLIGDLPIYVNLDSSDVWANSNFFKLDRQKRPLFVSGVPPDYFSETGQLWGNPVYHWVNLKKSQYLWWKKRFAHNFYFTPIVRIDHFRGFVAYWQVPRGEDTAINGKWVKAPVGTFFNEIIHYFPKFSIIAEDLGIITDDVKEIIRKYHFPGMKVLLFAFDGNPEENPYMSQNHIKNCILYTGTHDNNTAKGWFENEATPEAKERLQKLLNRDISPNTVSWELVKLAMGSVANTVILPMQDVLGLGEKARMNHPATVNGNWQWRLLSSQMSEKVSKRLRDLTKANHRC